MEEVLACLERKAKLKDVNIKITAAPTVTLLRNVPGPRLPNTVCDDPPKDAPISAPFPACKRIAAIMRKQTIKWIMIVRVYMVEESRS